MSTAPAKKEPNGHSHPSAGRNRIDLASEDVRIAVVAPMVEPDFIGRYGITADLLSSGPHRTLLAAVLRLHERGIDPSIGAVCHELDLTGELADLMISGLRGREAIVGLLESMSGLGGVYVGDVLGAVSRLRDDRRRREMEQRALRLAQLARDRTVSLQDVIDEADGITAHEHADGDDLQLVSAADFVRVRRPTEYLISGVIPREECGVLGGGFKMLKTGILEEVAVSASTGTPMFGMFDVPEPVETILISGESGSAKLQRTAFAIAEARGVDLAKARISWGTELPQLSRKEHMAALRRAIDKRRAKLVLLDPLFLMVLAADAKMAGNVFHMGGMLKQLTDISRQQGCSILVAHHFRKLGLDERFTDPSLEMLSQSGVAEWCRYWMLLGRRERYQPGCGIHRLHFVTGGSAGHSGSWHLTIDEGTEAAGWQWRTSLETAADSQRHTHQQKQSAKEEKDRKSEANARGRIETVLRDHPAGETKSKIRALAGVTTDVFERVFDVMIRGKAVVSCDVSRGNKAHYAGWKLARLTENSDDSDDSDRKQAV